MLLALTSRSIGRARGLLLALTALLCAFEFLLVIVAREFERLQAFSAIAALMPAAVQQMTGGLFFNSFGGLAAFGFVHPIVVLVIVEAAIFLASEPAWEVEAGIVDLTMARPIPRWLAVARTLIVVVGTTSGILLLMLFAMRLALQVMTPDGVSVPTWRTHVLLATNLMAIAWWFGAFSLLVASLCRRRSTAIGIAGISAIFLYLLNLLTEIWSKARGFRFVTPFHYYDAPALIRGSTAAWPADVALLTGTAAVMAILAWWAYSRRDL